MKTIRVSLALLLALGVTRPLVAADDGGRPGAFMDYAASARSLGMGQAFTAVSDDASAVYFNPSGVALMRRQNLVAQFSTLLESSSIGFFGFARPLAHNGGLGVGVVTLNSGDIVRRDEAGNKTGSYNTTSMAGLFSGAFSVGSALAFGSTAKIVRQSVAETSGVGFGLDLSAMIRASDSFRVGLMARNLVSPSVKLDQSSESFPRSFTLGLAVKPTDPLTLGLDIEKSANESARPRLGAEYLINDVLSLRTGVNKAEFSAGLGLGVGDWNFDYALGYSRSSSDVRALGAFHRFGIQFNFGLPVPRPAFGESAPRAASVRTVLPKSNKKKMGGAAAPVAVVTPEKSRPVTVSPAIEALHTLGDRMETWNGVPTPELQRQVDTVAKGLKKGLYLKAEDIYAAQGYLSYFVGEYATSARSLEQASEVAPQDAALPRRAQKARDQLLAATNYRKATERGNAPEIRTIREKFDSGDWNGTIVLAQRLLEVSPGNVDAIMYQHKSLERLVQPKLRQAKEFLDSDRYVESFTLFQKVLDLEPENAEAKAYSARVVQIIEKKSDMESASRAISRSDTSVQQGLSLFNKGLRLYAHGDVDEARNAWENALLQVKSYPLVYDTVRSALVDLAKIPG